MVVHHRYAWDGKDNNYWDERVFTECSSFCEISWPGPATSLLFQDR
jgi:hypothetical protein